jgi:hypothetical protein
VAAFPVQGTGLHFVWLEAFILKAERNDIFPTLKIIELRSKPASRDGIENWDPSGDSLAFPGSQSTIDR